MIAYFCFLGDGCYNKRTLRIAVLPKLFYQRLYTGTMAVAILALPSLHLFRRGGLATTDNEKKGWIHREGK
jgi:hypothetical protein